jgi:putative glutamine amidotransferase
MAESSASTDASRPLIGIGCDNDTDKREFSRVNADYYYAIYLAGGLPVLVPAIDDEAYCREAVRRLDGLLLPGGDDVHPSLYGQPLHPRTRLVTPRRQAADMALIRAALDADLPLMGICYAAQVINVALGGDMIQDIPDQVRTEIAHAKKWPDTAFHRIRIEPGTILHGIIGADEIETNSSHHQANLRVAPPLIISARADDGIIECVESTRHRFVLGIQWHPERLTDRPEQMRVFEGLVKAAAARH